MKILVARHDKLGDLTLALPAFEVLARGLPGAELVALVPEYTRPLVELSPHVSRVLSYPGAGVAARELARSWRPERFDALLSLWSQPQTALAGLLARIPLRLGPASRVVQVLHNVRVKQRRSRADKPEYAYNVELAAQLVARLGGDATCAAGFTRPVLRLAAPRVARRRAALCAELGLDPALPVVALHPGHGGSTSHLSQEQYTTLLRGLTSPLGHSTLITAGPGEGQAARALQAAAGLARSAVHESSAGLVAFCEVLAGVEVLIGGSTGPLHLAGALDTKTAGFYVRRVSGSATRWQTLNTEPRRLAFAPPPGAGEREMSALDVGAAARRISAHFLGAGGAT